MNLFLTNPIDYTKDKICIQSFMNEMTNFLKNFELSKANVLKEEGATYQVVELNLDGAFLQNLKTNQIEKEFDLSKEFLKQIPEEAILHYTNGKYVYDESLTDNFFSSLEDIKA